MRTKQTLGAMTIAVFAFVTLPSAQTTTQAAQTAGREEIQKRPITLVGCVQRESDYRRMQDEGRGGPLGLGLGRGDEYVLVDAVEITEGQATPAEANAACGAAAAGAAYELEGELEDDLETFVGRRVHISGTLGEADIDVATARPSGGVDPLGHDLKLFEVEVLSFREPMQRAESASPAVTDQVSPVGTSGVEPRAELPRTATPLPLVGVLGILSLAGALGLRLARRS